MSIHHLKLTATQPYERASVWVSVKGHITEEQFREGHRLCGDTSEFPGGRYKSWSTDHAFEPNPGVDPRPLLAYFRAERLSHEYETVHRWTGLEEAADVPPGLEP